MAVNAVLTPTGFLINQIWSSSLGDIFADNTKRERRSHVAHDSSLPASPAYHKMNVDRQLLTVSLPFNSLACFPIFIFLHIFSVSWMASSGFSYCYRSEAFSFIRPTNVWKPYRLPHGTLPQPPQAWKNSIFTPKMKFSLSGRWIWYDKHGRRAMTPVLCWYLASMSELFDATQAEKSIAGKYCRLASTTLLIISSTSSVLDSDKSHWLEARMLGLFIACRAAHQLIDSDRCRWKNDGPFIAAHYHSVISIKLSRFIFFTFDYWGGAQHDETFDGMPQITVTSGDYLRHYFSDMPPAVNARRLRRLDDRCSSPGSELGVTNARWMNRKRRTASNLHLFHFDDARIFDFHHSTYSGIPHDKAARLHQSIGTAAISILKASFAVLTFVTVLYVCQRRFVYRKCFLLIILWILSSI